MQVSCRRCLVPGASVLLESPGRRVMVLSFFSQLVKFLGMGPETLHLRSLFREIRAWEIVALYHQGLVRRFPFLLSRKLKSELKLLGRRDF